ncbi:MAG: phage tail terminator protein [Magnetospiraceae bacterium]
MIAKEVIARLEAECPLLTFIGGAIDNARALEGTSRAGEAYVVPVREWGDPPNTTGTDQTKHEQFAVVLALGAPNDLTGGGAEEHIRDVVNEVRAALVGWQPKEGWMDCWWREGGPTGIEHGLIWWQETFETFYRD